MRSLIEKVTVLHKADGTADVEVIMFDDKSEERTTILLSGTVESSGLFSASASRIELRVTHLGGQPATDEDVAVYAG